MKYFQAIKKGLSFGFQPIRWLPVFVIDLVFLTLFAGTVLTDTGMIDSLLRFFIFPGYFRGLEYLVAMAVAWFLARLWVVGGIIHQTHKEKEFGKSWQVSSNKYPSMFGSIVIVAVLGVGLSMIPLFGQLLSILVSVIFFFFLQSIVIKNQGVVSSLRDSYGIFRKHMNKGSEKKRMYPFISVATLLGIFHILVYMAFSSLGFGVLLAISSWISLAILAYLLFFSEVFRIWLGIALISVALILIFALPAFIIGAAFMGPGILMAGNGGLLSSIVLFYLTEPQMFLLSGAIFLVGSSIATVFALKVQAEHYIKYKKKFGIF